MAKNGFAFQKMEKMLLILNPFQQKQLLHGQHYMMMNIRKCFLKILKDSIARIRDGILAVMIKIK
jgi:hypothetical protein